MKIYLVGFMGAGKTTIGRELASRLEAPFFDIDDLVEASEKMSVKDIFAAHGEPYFRKRERDLLRVWQRGDDRSNQYGLRDHHGLRRAHRLAGRALRAREEPRALEIPGSGSHRDWRDGAAGSPDAQLVWPGRTTGARNLPIWDT